MFYYLRRVAMLVAFAAVPINSATSDNVVNLGYALYQGTFNPTTNITTFLGLRYAAPPTGPLRFHAPQPPINMTGLQQANVQPNECFQGSTGAAETPHQFLHDAALHKRAVVQSEDCLFLNVFVSGNLNPNASLPVVVWIHGGGYISGSAAGDGGDLVRDADGGVISIVIQYRLGVFGFLSGSEVKANGTLNAGLFDQRFALQWVQEHITAFGGDPNKVTIWGESAGAGSVLQHVVANGGKTDPPLFRAAMTSSTFVPPQYEYNDSIPEQLYATVVNMTDCTTSSDSLSCLRTLDSSVLGAINANLSHNAFFGTFIFVPVVDGDLIIEHPVKTMLKGTVNGGALLAVTNAFEGRTFVSNATLSDLSTYVQILFPTISSEQINATVAQYTNAGFDDTLDQAIAIMGESIFICPSYFLMEAFAERGFRGEFAIPPANHGDDIGEYFPSTRKPVTANSTFITSFSQSFLTVVKSLDPNEKFTSADITPLWAGWNSSATQMLFNVTDTDEAIIKPITTDSGLLSRCSLWQSISTTL